MRRLSRVARALSAALSDAAGTGPCSRSVATASAASASKAPPLAATTTTTTTTLHRLAAALAALVTLSAAAPTTTCEPAPPPSAPPPGSAVRSAVLSAWDAADADCHRDEASLPPLALLAGAAPPPPAAPPLVDVDEWTGAATVSFSLREGADELGVLLALAELLQALSSSPSSGSRGSRGGGSSSTGSVGAPVSVVPLQRGRDRGLRLSAGDAAATFLSASSSSSSPSAVTPKVELTAPASRLVAAQGEQQQQQQQRHSSSSSPLEKLFRSSNAVVSSFEEDQGGEDGGEGRRMRRRSFAKTWTWQSGGGGTNDESTSPRAEAVRPLLRGVDEVFRQSLEELFGPLEGGRREGEGGGEEGGGVRLEGRPTSPPWPPSPSPPSPSRPPSPGPAPPPPVPRGGSARAASAIRALEELGCSVFLPRPRPAAAAAAAPAEDPWSGLAAYERQKEEVRLALLPLTHPQVLSGIAAAAREGAASGGDALAAAPRAVLFEGPPGCGKTSSARAAARLAGVPLVVAPLEAIVSKWFGEAEQRLAAVFKHSRELAAASAASASAAGAAGAAAADPRPGAAAAPGVLLFVDEVDALATSRGEGGMHEATRRMLGTLLRELDGLRERRGGGGSADPDAFEGPSTSTGNVVAMLSTNRPGDLDAALASRCAARVLFPLPGLDDRAAVLALHARHLSEEQLAALARASEGLSPRDLADAAAAAERSWASRVVAGRAEPGTAPPFAEYKRAVEERAGRRW